MICLSIAWSPKIFKLQVKPNISNINAYRSLDNNNTSVKNVNFKTARNRMTLISSLLKIVLTILFSFSLNYFLNVSGNSNPGISVYNGFKFFSSKKELFVLFFIQVFSSLFGYLMCWLACTINLQKICFVLPLLLSTPVSAIIFLKGQFICESFGLICHEAEHWGWWKTVLLGVLMWLSQVISLNFEFFKSQQFLMAKEEYLFWLPTYDGKLRVCYL